MKDIRKIKVFSSIKYGKRSFEDDLTNWKLEGISGLNATGTILKKINASFIVSFLSC